MASATGAMILAGIPLRWWELGSYGALLLTAAVMRFWDLGSRAMHHDESLHAYYAWRLSNGEGFQHDPMMHGPFPFEANAAVFLVAGDSDYTSRLLYAVAGTVLVGLAYFLRARLGRVAALVVAGMLTFSPALLYFSRFARNDILVAVWTLALVIAMWRYIDEGKNRYLYITAALLALFFATKETAYLATGILGLYLVLRLAWRTLAEALRRVEPGGVSPGDRIAPTVNDVRRAARRDIQMAVTEESLQETLARLSRSVLTVARRGIRLSQVSRPSAFLVLMFTLALPQGAALVTLFQDTPLLSWANVVLGRSVDAGGLIGAPSGGGLVIAGAVVAALLGISIAIGARWNWPVWWRCALIFYGLWVLMFSSFFTNIDGIGSGWWRSLGYWIAQQEVARGSQPWYYYFIITWNYEFLPFLFSVVAGLYYMRRQDAFGRFLVYWAVVTFVAYTLASEKMPWLMVNITLPIILLAGKFLGEVTREIQWRRFVSGGGLYLLAGVPVMLWVLWRLAFADVDAGDLATVLRLLALFAVLGVLVASGVMIGRRVGGRDMAAFVVIPVALILLALTVRTGLRASYENGDVPIEMIVYTQTSADIPRVLGQIEALRAESVGSRVPPVNIDGTSGFAWPWAWYLREYGPVGYPTYQAESFSAPTNSSVLVIHADNQPALDPSLKDTYKEGVRIGHRRWFPEQTYRNLTFGKFLGGFVDRRAWRTAMDYFLHRKLSAPLGSEDAYVYFPRGQP